MMKKVAVFVAITGVMFTIGCDSGGSESNTIFTSMSPGTLLSDLTDAEANAMCLELQTQVETVLTTEDLCILGVMDLAQDVADGAGVSFEEACEALYEECINAEDAPEAPNCDEGSIAPGHETCDATVGELDQCLEDYLSLLETETASMECSGGEWDEPDDPDSCVALEEQCPDMDLF